MVYLTDELTEAWGQSDGTAAECERWDTALPVGYQTCVLCGGATGEGGVFARARGRMAERN
jgi:hypothetical protein